VLGKNAAAAKAFFCHAGLQSKILLGRSADPAKCDAKLERAFVKAEAAGGCPVVGDYASVQQRVVDSETDVMGALAAGMAATVDEKACVVRKNAATAKFAVCLSKALEKALSEKQLAGNLFPLVFTKCTVRVDGVYARADAGGGCLTTGDALAVRGLAVPAVTNFASADTRYGQFGRADLRGGNFQAADLFGVIALEADVRGADFSGSAIVDGVLSFADASGANFAGADLSEAYLVGTNLTGANLAGANLTEALMAGANLNDADLSGVIWSETLCPDETTSDTNGSSPESCCAHLQGSVPAACSP
jgi:hypothetical protein